MSGVRVPAPPPRLTLAPVARLRRVEPVLRRALSGACQLPRGARILAAVSGGADSTALLVALHRITPEFGLAMTAAHLNHGLRGAEADRDLDHVAALCARLDVPLIADAWDGPRWLTAHGTHGQSGLRAMRRKFLQQACLRGGATAIATAHTADDQLETLLMRIVRGSGLRGLGGMAERSGRWIKPLLGVTRAALVADLRRAQLTWREDASNESPAYLRNRIRLQVVPALARAGWPGHRGDGGADPAEHILHRERSVLASHASAAVAEVRSAERYIQGVARRLWPVVCRAERAEVRLDSVRMASYPLVLRRALFRETWKRFAPSSDGLTRRHLDLLDGMLRSPRGRSRIELPGGVVAALERDGVHWRLRSPSRRTAASRGAGL